jgi:hypothetical protein
MRKVVAITLFLLVFLPEYSVTKRGFSLTNFDRGVFFSAVIGPFSMVDLTLAFFFITVFLFKSKNQDMILHFSPGMKIYFSSVTLVVIFALLNSYYRNNLNPLYFMKPLVSIYLTYFIVKNLSLNLKEINDLFKTFTLITFLYSSLIFIQIITHKSLNVGIFYYVPYSIFMFFAIIFLLQILTNSRLNFYATIASMVIVGTCILGLVRSTWLSLVVSFVLIIFTRISIQGEGFVRNKGLRTKKTILVLSIPILLFLLNLKSSVIFSRLLSFNLFGSVSENALGYQDNADHLLELKHAIVAVKSNWLTGAGIGAGWQTSGVSIRGVAYGFHNSLTTVWFWFGLFGAILWILFPIILSYNFRKISIINDLRSLKTIRTLAWPIWIWAVYIPGLFFQSWIFTSQPISIFFGLVLALLADRRPKENA